MSRALIAVLQMIAFGTRPICSIASRNTIALTGYLALLPALTAALQMIEFGSGHVCNIATRNTTVRRQLGLAACNDGRAAVDHIWHQVYQQHRLK